MTIHGLTNSARHRFVLAGIAQDEAELDARLLAQEILGWDAARFFTSANEPPPPGFEKRYESLVARRAAREPVAYIIGRRDFWDLTFEVSPAVLIPRPETELIIEVALKHFPERVEALRAADVCTGSGCLAVTLAHQRPGVRFDATDISADALAIARRNANVLGVANRIVLQQMDLLSGLDGPFDLIVANPPYVPTGDRLALGPEVRDFEPAVALEGGSDGLDVIRRLVAQSASRLAPRGLLVFEFGAGQSDAVAELLSESPGLKMVDSRQDLQNIPRVAVAMPK